MFTKFFLNLNDVKKLYESENCQTSVLVLRLKVDFVFPLSQQREQQQKEQQQQQPHEISQLLLTQF